MEKEFILRKTRLAPTPSGFLHLGNIFSFALTAALAKRTGAKILLRIDDFDMERTRKQYVQDIFDTLDFMDIPWDEGPRNLKEYEHEFSIVHRMHNYKEALQQLSDDGNVFACTCSRAMVHADPTNFGYPGTCRSRNIPLEAENICWRLLTDDDADLTVRTAEGNTVTAKLPSDMKDFIIKKKDGFPAYQLISVMDDVHYGIDLVVRGEDLWSSTLAQQYLATRLGQNTFRDTIFYHHPLLTGTDGKKLAKSEGATSVYHLRQERKKPHEIYSLIAQIFNPGEMAGNWQELVGMMGFLPGGAE
jgi:glutamyl/glutaminyl-tRNA synthetase